MAVERIHQIALIAEDLETSVEFYRDRLGLQVIAKFDPPGLVFFDIGGVRLMLEKNAPKGTVYFRVDDIHAAHKELKEKGVEFIDEPHLIHRNTEGLFGPAGEEEWMSFFNDPSGNLLALAERKASAA